MYLMPDARCQMLQAVSWTPEALNICLIVLFTCIHEIILSTGMKKRTHSQAHVKVNILVDQFTINCIFWFQSDPFGR